MHSKERIEKKRKEGNKRKKEIMHSKERKKLHKESKISEEIT